METSLITINLVVRNGEKYIRHCLDSVLRQTYPHELIGLNILDNDSTDGTLQIIESQFENWKLEIGNLRLIKSAVNLGMWPGQEELLKHSRGKYIVILSVDVILDKDFVKNAVEQMEKDPTLGALQPKVYQWKPSPTPSPQLPVTSYQPPVTSYQLPTSDFRPPTSAVIDTCGFQIFRSRRLINIGQGEIDRSQFDLQKEVFAVEGAAPVFSRQALEDCRLASQDNKIVDRDFFWYGDDLDLAWRMRLFGWKEIYSPRVIAYHDRSTTKNLAKRWSDYLGRVIIRQQIPIKKRRLDWANYRLALIKNDHLTNLLKDLPRIAVREIMVLGYTLIFEPSVFLELPRFLRLIPKIAKRRKEIMSRAKVSASEIRKWMIT